MRFPQREIILLATAVTVGLAACTNSGAGDAIYCSPTRGPITISEGVDASALTLCPSNGVCRHGAGPQPAGVTPPAWECNVQAGDSGIGQGGSSGDGATSQE
jgi:hypothetical protein